MLGSYDVSFQPFANKETLFSQFSTSHFRSLSARKKFHKVNKTLLTCIQEAKEPCFLLPACLDFIAHVNMAKILAEPYHMLSFEFWLNHFSLIKEEENYRVRAKIVGKAIPREEYQRFFPIGMSKQFAGTHFVAAHLSPDIDTTIASFIGWIDAFGARVTSGLHQWSLPGTLQDSHVTNLFQTLFSPSVFSLLVRQTPMLTLTALDLMSKKEILKLPAATNSRHIDPTHTAGKPIIVVDANGRFKGDWRAGDAEAVRQVVMFFTSLLRWFENSVHARLISVLAKEVVVRNDVQQALDSLFDITLKMSEPLKELSDKQKKYQNEFLKKVIGLPKGVLATFAELIVALDKVTSDLFSSFRTECSAFDAGTLFAEQEILSENRPQIFARVEKIFQSLDRAIQAARSHVDTLEVLLDIREKILGLPNYFVTLSSDVEEIRNKMEHFDHLTVVVPEEDSSWVPIGAIFASDLKRQTLGTVSLRDFSNEEEVKMASYLEVISIVDHHKTSIQTSTVPTLVIGDAQSSNTLVAELQLEINERYSLMGIPEQTIQEALGSTSVQDEAKYIRLLQLKINAQKQTNYFIHPQREFAEYLCFLNAILDDTDLLTKVSARDVECVCRLLNRMKSIATGNDTEIVTLLDIPKDALFAQKAASRILRNDDMYSIYKQIYAFKEKEVETNLAACVGSQPSSIFADTKEQNGCCRVGQTKMFCTNYPFFKRHVATLRAIWFKQAHAVYETTPQIDLHMQMISTIAGADEVYHGQSEKWKHQDEIWLWAPPSPQAMGRLVNFLNNFQTSSAVQQNSMEVEFLGPNAPQLDLLFAQNFSKASRKIAPDFEKGLPLAALRFPAGLINSRKAMITPYLPRFIA